LLQFTENDMTERMVYRMFFLGRNFVSSTLKSLKNLKTFSKNVGFFPALFMDQWSFQFPDECRQMMQR